MGCAVVSADNLSAMATRRTKTKTQESWLLLIYKVPSESSRARVARKMV